MPTCPYWRAGIEADLHGQLEAERATALASHLIECSACREYRRDAERIDDILTRQATDVTARVDWERVARRVRRLRRWRANQLATKVGLLVAAIVAAITLDASILLSAGVFLFLVLPMAYEKYHDDRRRQRQAESGISNWIEYYRDQLERRRSDARSSGWSGMVIALFFAMAALTGNHPEAAAAVSAIMLISSLYRLWWTKRRIEREVAAFDGPTR